MDNLFIFHKSIHDIQNFQIISYENKKRARYGQEAWNLEHLHYGQTYLKNIKLPVCWTFLKVKWKTGNASMPLSVMLNI